jgi:hypothetical protein
VRVRVRILKRSVIHTLLSSTLYTHTYENLHIIEGKEKEKNTLCRADTYNSYSKKNRYRLHNAGYGI